MHRQAWWMAQNAPGVRQVSGSIRSGSGYLIVTSAKHREEPDGLGHSLSKQPMSKTQSFSTSCLAAQREVEDTLMCIARPGGWRKEHQEYRKWLDQEPVRLLACDQRQT